MNVIDWLEILGLREKPSSQGVCSFNLATGVKEQGEIRKHQLSGFAQSGKNLKSTSLGAVSKMA